MVLHIIVCTTVVTFTDTLRSNICCQVVLLHVLTAVGVAHPITVGFWLPGDHNLHQHYPNNYPTVTAVKLTSRDLDIRHVEAKVREFLTSGMLADYEKVPV